MDSFVQDLKYAFRSLRRSPAFVVVAVLTLALGIGANTAIFSVVNSVLLEPLPYPAPDRLVMVWERHLERGRLQNVVSPANFLDWRDRSRSFEGLAGTHFSTTTFTGESPEVVEGRAVTANYFQVVGVTPSLGRTFSREEALPNAPAVLVLSDGLWKRRFGADPNIVGKSFPIAGGNITVIGVMPAAFQPINGSDQFWEAWQLNEANRQRRGRYASVVGRLKPGVTIAQAQAEMDNITGALATEYPEFDTGWSANVMSLADQVVGRSRTVLWMLLGAVSLVLLIACANVANLLLVRASSRQREIAVRTALGAPGWRLARQWLLESVVVAMVGGAAGVLLATWGIDLLVALAPSGVPRLSEIGVDGRVLGVTLFVSLLVGLVFGLPAALGGVRSPAEGLHASQNRATTSGRVARFRSGLVVAQMSLALVLLAGAGLLIRSIGRLTSVDPGFNAANLATVELELPRATYGDSARTVAFYQQLLERVRQLPGIQGASAVTWLPMVGLGSATSYTIVGRPEPPAGQKPGADIRVIDPFYFTTMGIPLQRGRGFSTADHLEAPPVVVITETMATQMFPGEDPIGKRLMISWRRPTVQAEIVGIVADIKAHGFDGDVRPMIYYPHAQEPSQYMNIIIRTQGDPLASTGMIRAAIREMDKDLPVGDVATMYQWLTRSTADRRYPMFLLAVFAGLALSLAAIGIYGVLSYTVGQRTREIGVRMALGAEPGTVLRMVVKNGLVLTLTGVVLGAIGAAFAARALGRLLYATPPTDPLTFLIVAATLTLVAMLACLIPALRAARTDPMVALRSE